MLVPSGCEIKFSLILACIDAILNDPRIITN